MAASAGQQIQKVYSEWCVKAAEIILAARLESDRTGTLRKSSSFNLQVPELFNVRSEAIARPEFFQLRTQRSFQVEIYLSEESGDDAGEGELLERWTFTFLPAPAHPEGNQMERHNGSLIRKLTVVLRTLLFFVRLQPAHGVCRGPNPPARCHRFRVEAWPPASRPSAVELVSQDFVTLQSTVGTLRLSVSQRKDLKSLSFAGPLKGVAAISSQTEKIELEEGFFASEPTRLDKITEEEVRGEDETPLAGAVSTSLPAETVPVGASSIVREGDGELERTRSQEPKATPPSAPLTGPCASSSSSRSMTPLGTPASTPLQGPCELTGPLSAVERSLSSTDPGGGGYEDKMTLTSSGGGADDLSNFWMSNLPGRRRGRSLDGSHGTGTSRSVSPEAPSRQPSLGDLQSSRGRGWSGSVCSTGGPRPGEEGEICLFGMSSDEEEKDAATEDDLDRNVVASAIMEGGGGGAFATASRMDAAKLGFPDFESDGQPSISRRNSDSQGASPKAMFSPLIAQLNPFQPPPGMDLPEADPNGGEEAAAGASVPAEANVAQLVEEMGDLVCRLQQRQELQIVSQEVRPEDLYRRLDHFREFAEALAR